jgi:uncharacterized membrane protein YoaK (UPF0700 family)
MTGAPRRVWTALARDDVHGPLPALLLVLTAATGVVDAVSILGLGRVFVANMTGNVAFVGFALAGTPEISLTASLAALAAFLTGAAAAGPLVVRWGGHRGRLLRNATLVELGLIAVGLVIATAAPPTSGSPTEWTVATPLALAMGLQNSAVRKLAVPDLTTSVLTMTLTGIAADGRRSGVAAAARRTLAVLTMLVGALAGALLMLHVGMPWALGLVAALIGVVAVIATFRSRDQENWHTRGQRAG